MIKKTTGLFCAFLILAANQSTYACCSSETIVEEINPPFESISDEKAIEAKEQNNDTWLIDIEGVGLYYCLAHGSNTCVSEEYCNYLHPDEVEYVAFGGRKMHVVKILERIKDNELTKELSRAKTPDSYHRTALKISKMMGKSITNTPYPVIRIRSKKRNSSRSKSC